MSTPLVTSLIKVLAAIKEKKIMQYLPFIKNDSNTRNPNKFCLFHHDHGNETKECHARKNEM